MTEETARDKWCPMVRYKSIRGEGINRWTDDGDTTLNPTLSHCIASDCMMWQADGASKEGFCGLAGKPWWAFGWKEV